jgi:hypothetical protein
MHIFASARMSIKKIPATGRTKQPCHVFGKLLNISKVAIRFGMSASGITGPYSYEEGKCASNVNSTQHRAMLETRQVNADDGDGELWFEQVGATQHTAREPNDCSWLYVHWNHHVLVTSPGQPGLMTCLGSATFLGMLGSQSVREQTAHTWGGGMGLTEHIRVEIRTINKGLFSAVTVNCLS